MFLRAGAPRQQVKTCDSECQIQIGQVQCVVLHVWTGVSNPQGILIIRIARESVLFE